MPVTFKHNPGMTLWDTGYCIGQIAVNECCNLHRICQWGSESLGRDTGGGGLNDKGKHRSIVVT